MYLERLDQVTQRAIVAVYGRTKQPGKEMRCVHSQLSLEAMESVEQELMNVTGMDRYMFLYSKDTVMGAWIDWRKAPMKARQDWWDLNGGHEPLFPKGPSKGPGDVLV